MRGGRIRAPAAIAGAWLLVVLIGGCASTQEPASAYSATGPLAFEFKTVWEAASEALHEEGYPVDGSEKTADDEGVMVSRTSPGRDDKLRGLQEGRRVRARVEKLGPKSFRLYFAASRFERDLAAPGQTPGEWRYVGRDEDLLGRLRTRFDKAIERRYRPQEGG